MIHAAYIRGHESNPAFTLAEIAITLGIVAGTALLTLALLSSLTRNVQRLKEGEAPLRPGKTVNPGIYHPNHPLPDCDALPAPPSVQQVQ